MRAVDAGAEQVEGLLDRVEVGAQPHDDRVAEAVVAGLTPFREAYAALEDAEVNRIMEAGAAAARERAEVLQQRVRRRVGLAV